LPGPHLISILVLVVGVRILTVVCVLIVCVLVVGVGILAVVCVLIVCVLVVGVGILAVVCVLVASVGIAGSSTPVLLALVLLAFALVLLGIAIGIGIASVGISAVIGRGIVDIADTSTVANSRAAVGINETTTRLSGLELSTNSRADTSTTILLGTAVRPAVSIIQALASNKLLALSVADILGTSRVRLRAFGIIVVIGGTVVGGTVVGGTVVGGTIVDSAIVGSAIISIAVGSISSVASTTLRVNEATASLSGLELGTDSGTDTSAAILLGAAVRSAVSVIQALASNELLAFSVADVLSASRVWLRTCSIIGIAVASVVVGISSIAGISSVASISSISSVASVASISSAAVRVDETTASLASLELGANSRAKTNTAVLLGAAGRCAVGAA
jgi:hypothetical protein